MEKYTLVDGYVIDLKQVKRCMSHRRENDYSIMIFDKTDHIIESNGYPSKIEAEYEMLQIHEQAEAS